MLQEYSATQSSQRTTPTKPNHNERDMGGANFQNCDTTNMWVNGLASQLTARDTKLEISSIITESQKHPPAEIGSINSHIQNLLNSTSAIIAEYVNSTERIARYIVEGARQTPALCPQDVAQAFIVANLGKSDSDGGATTTLEHILWSLYCSLGLAMNSRTAREADLKKERILGIMKLIITGIIAIGSFGYGVYGAFGTIRTAMKLSKAAGGRIEGGKSIASMILHEAKDLKWESLGNWYASKGDFDYRVDRDLTRSRELADKFTAKDGSVAENTMTELTRGTGWYVALQRRVDKIKNQRCLLRSQDLECVGFDPQEAAWGGRPTCIATGTWHTMERDCDSCTSDQAMSHAFGWMTGTGKECCFFTDVWDYPSKFDPMPPSAPGDKGGRRPAHCGVNDTLGQHNCRK